MTRRISLQTTLHCVANYYALVSMRYMDRQDFCKDEILLAMDIYRFRPCTRQTVRRICKFYSKRLCIRDHSLYKSIYVCVIVQFANYPAIAAQTCLNLLFQTNFIIFAHFAVPALNAQTQICQLESILLQIYKIKHPTLTACRPNSKINMSLSWKILVKISRDTQ